MNRYRSEVRQTIASRSEPLTIEYDEEAIGEWFWEVESGR
jgi:hypothetical protein